MDVFLSLMKLILILGSPLWISMGFLIGHIILRLMYQVIIKKRPIPKRGSYNNGSFLRNVFIKVPKLYVDDLLNRKDYEFREYGLHMVCGEQGSGKTTTVCFLLKKWKAMYPKMKIATNMDYKHQHAPLNHWNQMVSRNNGVYGQCEVIDEIQTWFSSNQSKDFPVEMLSEVSQQRKQRKAIIGTAQVFSRISKPIREQTSFVHLPWTILGVFTFVRISKPQYWDDEKQEFKKYIGYYYFIHTKDIRDSFDTFKRIKKYQEVGFKPDSVNLMDRISS